MSNYGWLKTLLMFVLAFAVQSTIGDWLKILGVGPDFVLIFIVSVALRFGAATGCLWGCAISTWVPVVVLVPLQTS